MGALFVADAVSVAAVAAAMSGVGLSGFAGGPVRLAPNGQNQAQRPILLLMGTQDGRTGPACRLSRRAKRVDGTGAAASG